MNPFFQSLGIYSAFMAVAVFLGGIVPLFRHWHRQRLPLILSFSAGLLLGSAFFHLIPEGFASTGVSLGAWVLAGFLFLYFVEHFITVHICEGIDCEVHKLGISTFIGIALHSLIDGIALGSGLLVPGLGFVVFTAIVGHKAPEVFSLTTVLLHGPMSKAKIALINLCVWAMIPTGALMAYGFLRSHDPSWIGKALGFSAGTFLHIALSDLLPEVHKHGVSKALTSLLLLAGLLLMWLLNYHLKV
jgi:zinc and cadmium transporter